MVPNEEIAFDLLLKAAKRRFKFLHTPRSLTTGILDRLYDNDPEDLKACGPCVFVDLRHICELLVTLFELGEMERADVEEVFDMAQAFSHRNDNPTSRTAIICNLWKQVEPRLDANARDKRGVGAP